jgi:ribosomal peptide maturation radical SAM protein 1
VSDVVFVQMPFAGIERPSLALGLFTSSLRADGTSTEAVYANIGFAERIGLAAYTLMRLAAPSSLLGEWIFSESAFRDAAAGLPAPRQPDRHFDVDAVFIDTVVRDLGHADLPALLLDLRRRAALFVEETSREILRLGPRVVACTSMFDQHAASLALLRRLKELAPGVFTAIGGANCAGPMGRATHDALPSLDFTVTGEFDPYAASFFRGLVAAEGDPARVGPLPPNVLGPADHAVEGRGPLPPGAILTDMDRAAVPDYDDFFEQLYSSPVSGYVVPSIPLETSRGCWWGAKQHCTFCGLNAEGMSFRKKNPARALDEIRALTSRYGIYRFSATDNILDMSYFQTVLPELAADGRGYNFFYETKANLKREHVKALADAGCYFIQPGIESLHDETLRIMRKGNTACGNIQLLKYCVELGVTPAWSILCGFPGSDPEWVAEVAEELPLLFHLPPPNGTTPIRFDRFSPYEQRPADYGLTLEPLQAYRMVYPVEEGVLRGLAYFFRDAGGTPRRVAETARSAGEVTTRWRSEFWGPGRGELVIEAAEPARGEAAGEALRVRDTRSCAVASVHELRGLAATLLRALDAPASPAGLLTRLKQAGSAADEAAVEKGLCELRERRLLWRSSSQLVALPTPPPVRPLREGADVAVGKVDMAKYFTEKVRFKRVAVA